MQITQTLPFDQEPVIKKKKARAAARS